MTESETAFTVTAEIPGVAEDDIEVTLTQNTLTIKGEKKWSKKRKKKGITTTITAVNQGTK